MDTRSRTSSPPRSYQDFEPSSEWIQDDKSETLLVKLPGFKKEQMNVKVDSYRNLRASGERPLGGNNNRWSRFLKDIHIPETLDLAGIRAKFENGTLHVIIPKLIVKQTVPAPTQEVAANQKTDPSPLPTSPQNGMAKASEPGEKETVNHGERNVVDQGVAKESASEEQPVSSGSDGSATGSRRLQKKVLNGVEKSRQLLMDTSARQLLLNAAVAIFVLVGLGVFVTFLTKKGSTDYANRFFIN